MPSFKAPRGTRDILPAERVTWSRLERTAADLAGRYGYREIETPLFEQTEVFERGVGEVTDVVEKELFRIAPRTEEAESWSLRPEPTAGIVRAYVQHGMQTWPQPVKLTLVGPMFRYDRPQAGRYRQFWQFDVEAIGDPGPAVDAELVELGLRFYRDVGLDGVEVLLNSIGDAACRPAYIAELTDYYRAHVDRLPPLERERLERNPLRLLDSKEAAMQELNALAPKITDRLCEACAAHFAEVRAHLDALGVAYRLEPTLVRGLDYYTRTAFEFYRRGAEGQQQALGGGGRYDGLVELLGGKPTPGIGFGIGLDRVVLALESSGGRAGTRTAPGGRRRGRRPGRHRGPAACRDRASRGGSRRSRGTGPAQARQAARGRGQGARPLRRDHRRRAGRRPGPGEGSRGRHAAPRRGSRTCHASSPGHTARTAMDPARRRADPPSGGAGAARGSRRRCLRASRPRSRG